LASRDLGAFNYWIRSNSCTYCFRLAI